MDGINKSARKQYFLVGLSNQVICMCLLFCDLFTERDRSWMRTAVCAPPVSYCSGGISAHSASSSHRLLIARFSSVAAAQDNVKPGIIWVSPITGASAFVSMLSGVFAHLILIIWWADDPLCGFHHSSFLPWRLKELWPRGPIWWHTGSTGAIWIPTQSRTRRLTVWMLWKCTFQPTIHSEVKECYQRFCKFPLTLNHLLKLQVKLKLNKS